MMMRKVAVVLLLSLMVFGTFAATGRSETGVAVVRTEPVAVSVGNYTPHAPIRINNDTDPAWNEFPNRTISGLEINGSGYTFCIYVGNCTVPFTIVNCYLHDMSMINLSINNKAIELKSSSNAIIMNNQIYQNDVGIAIVMSSNMTISYNRIIKHTVSISVGLSERIIVNGNECSDDDSGISVRYSNYCQISNNIFHDSLYLDAVYFNIFYSCYNYIVNNTMQNCGLGIKIEAFSISNLIINNSFMNQMCGIWIKNDASTLNRIFQNSFIKGNESSWQALDTEGNNFWNDTTGHGNYWSDWTGPDNNSDGIVDLPYIIDGGAGAMDYYPLAAPVVIAESPPPTLALVILVLLPLIVFARRKR